MGAWIELFRALGQALIEVVKAELDEVRGRLAASGKQLGLALGLLAAALLIGFWAIALLLYTLVAVLAIWLPQWAAAAIVLGFALLVMAVLAAIGVTKLKRLENPAETVGRQWRGHLDWWNRQLLAQGGAVPGPPPPPPTDGAPEEES
jgi:hypothetical protein